MLNFRGGMIFIFFWHCAAALAKAVPRNILVFAVLVCIHLKTWTITRMNDKLSFSRSMATAATVHNLEAIFTK